MKVRMRRFYGGHLCDGVLTGEIDLSSADGAQRLVAKLAAEHGPLSPEEELGIIYYAWGRSPELPGRIRAAIRGLGE